MAIVNGRERYHMGEQFDRLKQRLGQVHSLNRALAVLSWDQHTHMPPGGARARAQQMSDLARMSHDIFITDETGELLQAAAQEVANLSPDSDDASLVRVAQRDYEEARRVPS